MGRIFMALGLVVLFIGWALYHLLVKKDLMRHRSTLLLSCMFFAAWGLLYWSLWT